MSASNTGSFTVSYTVAEGDPEQLSAGNLTWSCELRDSDGNVGTSHGVLHTPSGGIAQFTVATHSPKVALGADGSIRSTRYPTANIGSHISIELQTSDGSMAQDQPLTIVPNECLVDGSASSNDISIVPEPDTRYYLLVADVVDGGKDVSMGSNISINCLCCFIFFINLIIIFISLIYS